MAGAPRAAALLLGLAQASHPFPVAIVLALTALVGIASGPADAYRLALATLAMLLSQLAIGWSNDYLDREYDRAHRPEKPVPAGLVPARVLPPLTAAALASAVAVGAALGPDVLGLLLAGTACGLGYNLALKRTPFSWAAYVLAFALLPAYVWAALDQFRGELWWLYVVGAPLALAAHIANTLPDLAEDASSGQGGLVARLGRRRAIALLFGCLALPPASTALTALWLEYAWRILLPALAGYAVFVSAAATAYRSVARRNASLAFRLIGVAAVLLASAWLAAV
ncbi:MAG TPA: UbiA family prenyltransferase [Dehalococcoidia bacterium]|nr:UbiA family prenyltransferase [Dehalococcoidia bacterium]